jgi:hypothetical protein
MASTTLTAYEGVMINYRGESGVLGIGAGNFASEKYVHEKGVEIRGATGGLWLALRGRPETNAFHRVHAGQQIDFDDFRIKVLAIGSNRRGMFVRFKVSEEVGGKNVSRKNEDKKGGMS